MVIYIISDGKRGHLSQTRGLAAALLARARRQRPEAEHSCHEVEVTGMGFFAKMFYKGRNLDLPKPDLILCAGHGTHAAALSLARHLHCLCMVCMKPSLPLRSFDLCLIPRHDMPDCRVGEHVFLTVGAINAISVHPETEKKETLVLIGGPSKEYKWDAEMVINQLSTIVRHNRGNIVLTTSRRTPTDFVQDVTTTCPSVRVEPVEETGETWVADHLACAREVWVTQDSVSMVYEALSAGAPVGIIEMKVRNDKRKGITRVARGLNMLIGDRAVSTFTEWAKSHELPLPEHTLNEAGRAADYILQRFPQLLS